MSGSARSFINYVAVGLLASFASLGCSGAGGGLPAKEGAVAEHELLGAPAPDFELKEVPGAGTQSLGAHAGKVVVVDFWATWCQPCKESFPAYQKLMAKRPGQLVVIAISQDDDPSGIAEFRSETGVTFPIVWDESKTVAQSYDPPTMPTAFVLDKSGIVRFVHVGFRAGDERKLEDELRSLSQ